jgi:hypothetical protein
MWSGTRNWAPDSIDSLLWNPSRRGSLSLNAAPRRLIFRDALRTRFENLIRKLRYPISSSLMIPSRVAMATASSFECAPSFIKTLLT